MKFYTKEKLSRLAKIIDFFAKLNMGLAVFFVASMVILPIFPSLRDNLFNNLSSELTFGNISIDFYDKTLLPDYNVLLTKVLFEVFRILLSILSLFLISWFLHKMMKELREEKYLTKEFARNFKKLAIVVFVSSLFITLLYNTFYSVFFESYDIWNYIDSYEDSVVGYRPQIVSNFEPSSSPISLATGLFMWIIAILLEHSSALQKEHEETL